MGGNLIISLYKLICACEIVATVATVATGTPELDLSRDQSVYSHAAANPRYGGNPMDFNDNYLDITADAFSEMHILIEGAIAIFENDTGPLNRLATQHKEYEARMALNDVGAALYTLRRHITRLQTAVHDESERLHAARKENYND